MIRDINWETVKSDFYDGYPFRHAVIDNFFIPEVAEKLSAEFPDFNSADVIKYKNPLEHKHTLNKWDMFPPTTYRTFHWLGDELTSYMADIIDNWNLKFDYGLNGGGWHMHGRGGNNNIHLDYNLHPKSGRQRKLNIIVYLTENWKPEWGGGLELWTDDYMYRRTKQQLRPDSREKTIDNIFNRAVIFDTTNYAWHGLPDQIDCPEGIIRKSIAGYYTLPAPPLTDPRCRALFTARPDQEDDAEVEELIKKRADMNKSNEVYRT